MLDCKQSTTGDYYACKVINKRLMQGREAMVSLESVSFVQHRLP